MKINPNQIDEYKRLQKLKYLQYCRLAKKSFLNFMKFCWPGPGHFINGPHLEAIAAELDLAIDNFKKGISTNILIAVPFRHGKTTAVSKLFPAYFLATCADAQPSVLLSGYGSSIVLDSSSDCKRIIAGDKFNQLYPDIKLDPDSNRIDNWKIDKSAGRVVSVGLGGALAGRGFHLGILDDYMKNRIEAESPTYRQATWQSFTNDFLTRRQKPSITIVIGTPWNIDDIRGRILLAMSKDSNFPQFKNIMFPAKNKDGTFLWESFLGREWYLNHYCTLTPYEASSLLDCDPEIKVGGMFNSESLKKVSVNSIEIKDVIACQRYWDKASTGGGGCFTAGSLLLKMRDKRIVVYDITRGQWESGEREKRMRACAEADKQIFGNLYRIGIEQEPGSGGVDSARYSVQNLAGFTVLVDKVSGSKENRAGPFASQVNSGNVAIVDALWNNSFIDELTAFPTGRTKDMVDATTGAFNKLFWSGTGGSGGTFESKTTF